MHAFAEEGTATAGGKHALIDTLDPPESSPRSAPGDGNVPAGPFHPDRDTVRPTIRRYDDPFMPSAGPFKRVLAFDAVRDDYTLAVRDPELVPIAIDSQAESAAQTFLGDLPVELTGGDPVRIPSVGPGAHVVRARLTAGMREVPFRILHDGADNWFIESTDRAAMGPARLVMTLALDERSLTSAPSDTPWQSIPPVQPLPAGIGREAVEVLATIGASRRMLPHQAIGRLVQYFRSFTDSAAPTPARRSIYLDLALSKIGVCRHRAFAFLVTAQSLGIPTRLVMNEAHAWVEVHDGTSWRRIDLGGAGVLQDAAALTLDRPAYEPPPDPFGWPDGSRRASDMLVQAHAERTGPGLALSRPAPAGATDPPPDVPSPTLFSEGPRSDAPGASVSVRDTMSTGGATSPEDGARSSDPRPPSTIELHVADTDVHRGFPLRVRGSVSAAGARCPYAAVDLWARSTETGRQTRLGTVATDEGGTFTGSIAVPQFLPAGDYDVVAHTGGAATCGRGSN